MRRRKNIKIHRYEKKRRRREIVGPGRTLLSICFTFVVAGAIGVVGYSIAKPILTYTKGDSASEDLSLVSEETQVTTQTGTMIQTGTESTETTTELTTESAVTVVNAMGLGIYLDSTAMTDLQSLQNAIVVAKQEQPSLSFLVLPLKVEGGTILYQTGVTLAQTCGAAQGTLTLEEIVAAVEEAGLTPIAQCSLLYDNLLPDADAAAGYVIASSGTRWLDNRADNGGKPWVSPFSTVTVQYLTDLTTEIAAAGFSQIWCSDVIFPSFRSTDLEYIGEIVQSADRGDTLTELVNTLVNAAGETSVLLEVDGATLVAGTDEAFDAQTLEAAGIVVDLDTETDTSTVLAWLTQNAADWQAVLTLSTDRYTTESTIVDTAIIGWAIK